MAEIFGGGSLHKAFKELGIKATRTYRRSEKPFYEVWELSKEDAKALEYETEWKDDWGWFHYSSGGHRGTAFECLTINGKFVIGWTAKDNKDTFDNLTDYFTNGLGIIDVHMIAAYSVSLAKSNGWTLSKTWEMLEG